MKKIILLSPLFIALLWSNRAIADPGPCCRAGGEPHWYVGLSSALTFLASNDLKENLNIPGVGDFTDSIPISYKAGFTASGQVGYRIYPNIRAEFEASYRQNRVDTIEGIKLEGNLLGVETEAFMANLYYDWHNPSHLTPYLGIGYGPARMLTNDGGGIWRLGEEYMAGVNYEFTAGENPVQVGIGYRYFNSTNEPKFTLKGPDFSYSEKLSMRSDNIEVGARFFF